ncbi:MAG: glutathione S-transferase family protein [Myxococcota bacterium]
MKLYVNRRSPNCHRALITARLVGLPIEIVDLDMGNKAHLEPWYLAINPNHKVPALQDGAFSLWESNAISIYLANKAERRDLWPTDAAAQADVARWMMWTHTHWNLALGPIVFERVFKKAFGMGEPDESVVAGKMGEWHDVARLVDAHLEGKEWLATGQLTLADVSLGASLMYAEPAAIPFEGHPRLAAWFARVSALPAWQS